MAKQRMIVTDDQLLIDMDLLFNAIRDADGDWEQVEEDMQMYLSAVQSMSDWEDDELEDDEDDDADDSDDDQSDESKAE